MEKIDNKNKYQQSTTEKGPRHFMAFLTPGTGNTFKSTIMQLLQHSNAAIFFGRIDFHFSPPLLKVLPNLNKF